MIPTTLHILAVLRTAEHPLTLPALIGHVAARTAGETPVADIRIALATLERDAAVVAVKSPDFGTTYSITTAGRARLAEHPHVL